MPYRETELVRLSEEMLLNVPYDVLPTSLIPLLNTRETVVQLPALTPHLSFLLHGFPVLPLTWFSKGKN